MFLSFFGQFGGPIFGGTWWNPRLKKKMVSGQLGAITLGTGFLLRALNIPFSMKSKWFPYYVRGSWPFMTFLNLFGDDNSHVLLQLTHCLGPRITETKRQCNKRVTIESKGNKHKNCSILCSVPVKVSISTKGLLVSHHAFSFQYTKWKTQSMGCHPGCPEIDRIDPQNWTPPKTASSKTRINRLVFGSLRKSLMGKCISKDPATTHYN